MNILPERQELKLEILVVPYQKQALTANIVHHYTFNVWG